MDTAPAFANVPSGAPTPAGSFTHLAIWPLDRSFACSASSLTRIRSSPHQPRPASPVSDSFASFRSPPGVSSHLRANVHLAALAAHSPEFTFATAYSIRRRPHHPSFAG
jgi:hypothetical protein